MPAKVQAMIDTQFSWPLVLPVTLFPLKACDLAHVSYCFLELHPTHLIAKGRFTQLTHPDGDPQMPKQEEMIDYYYFYVKSQVHSVHIDYNQANEAFKLSIGCAGLVDMFYWFRTNKQVRQVSRVIQLWILNQLTKADLAPFEETPTVREK